MRKKTSKNRFKYQRYVEGNNNNGDGEEELQDGACGMPGFGVNTEMITGQRSQRPGKILFPNAEIAEGSRKWTPNNRRKIQVQDTGYMFIGNTMTSILYKIQR